MVFIKKKDPKTMKNQKYGLCSPIGVGIYVREKKIDYCYMVQFNSLQHRLYSELYKNVK